MSRSRGQHRGVVVGRHLLVRALDSRLVAAGHRDAGPQLVRHHRLRHAAEELKGADVAGDPVGPALRPRRLGEGEVGSAEHRHEELDVHLLAGRRVPDAGPLACVVDEDLLAGAVDLAHRRPTTLRPQHVLVAKPAVAVAARLALQVLQVQQLHRHAGAPPLGMDSRPVGHRAGRRSCGMRSWVQARLQLVIG